MEHVRLLTVAMLSLGLIGCSSSSTPSNESASENAATNNSGEADNTSNTDMSSMEETNSSNETTGNIPALIAPGDPNPGSVPDPVLAELTDLAIVNFGGHKVYAGQEETQPWDYGYFNIDFKCDGTGTFEGYPKVEDTGLTYAFAQGTITWAQDESLDERVQVTVTDIVDNPGLIKFDFDEIPIDNDFGTAGIIVGESAIDRLVISRIVQYEECP